MADKHICGKAVLLRVMRNLTIRLCMFLAAISGAATINLTLTSPAQAQTSPPPTGGWCISATTQDIYGYYESCTAPTAHAACQAGVEYQRAQGLLTDDQLIAIEPNDAWNSVQCYDFGHGPNITINGSWPVLFKCYDGTPVPSARCAPIGEDFESRAPDDPHQPDDCARPTGGRTPHPIDVLTGSKLFENIDYSAADGQLRLRRLYNSTPYGGAFAMNGPVKGLVNWNFDFQFEVHMNAFSNATNGGLVTLLTPSGGAYEFQLQAGVMVPHRPSIRPNPQSDYTLTLLDAIDWPTGSPGARPLYFQVTHWKVVDADGRTITFQSFPDSTGPIYALCRRRSSIDTANRLPLHIIRRAPSKA